MRTIYVILIFLVMAGCGTAERSLELLSQLDPEDELEGYRLKLGYSALVMNDITDFEQGKMVVGRLVELGAWDEARYCARHLLEANGPDAGLHYQVAVCLGSQLHFRKALEEINHAIALGAGLHKYREEQERLTGLLGTWQKIDSLSDLLVRSQEPDIYNERARLLISMRRFQSARDDLNTVLDKEEDNIEAIYLKGILLFNSYDYAGAAEIFNQLSRVELSSGQEKLIGFYKASASKLNLLDGKLKNEPASPEVYLDFSRELSQIGDYNRALHMINRGLESAPEDPRLLQASILVYIQQGNVDSAREAALFLESLGYKTDPQLKQLLK